MMSEAAVQSLGVRAEDVERTLTRNRRFGLDLACRRPVSGASCTCPHDLASPWLGGAFGYNLWQTKEEV